MQSAKRSEPRDAKRGKQSKGKKNEKKKGYIFVGQSSFKSGYTSTKKQARKTEKQTQFVSLFCSCSFSFVPVGTPPLKITQFSNDEHGPKRSCSARFRQLQTLSGGGKFLADDLNGFSHRGSRRGVASRPRFVWSFLLRWYFFLFLFRECVCVFWFDADLTADATQSQFRWKRPWKNVGQTSVAGTKLETVKQWSVTECIWLGVW